MDADRAPVTGGAGEALGEASGAGGAREALGEALGDWRRDALLLCLLPVFCWPALAAAVLGRPPVLVAALCAALAPVLLGARELHAARRVRRALRDPAVRWTPYEAVVVRARWRPPVLVLAGGRHVLTLDCWAAGCCRRARGPVRLPLRPWWWCGARVTRPWAGPCGPRTPARWATPGPRAPPVPGSSPAPAGEDPAQP